MPASGLINLIDERNILLGPGRLEFPIGVNVGQIKGDVEFAYMWTPYDVEAGLPLLVLRRFVLRERASVTVPILELHENFIAYGMRNIYQGGGGATFIGGTPLAGPPGGTLFGQEFGGSNKLKTNQALFLHPTPEGGFVRITGFKVVPPPELRMPFPEQRETIVNTVWEFLHDTTRAVGGMLGRVEIFKVPIC